MASTPESGAGEIRASAPAASDDAGRLVLCLSGGGFRASLFHLGVLYKLQRRKELGSIVAIVSVSGGSIISAYLVQHWDDMLTDDGFDKHVKILRRVIERQDIRGKVLRSTPWITLKRSVFRLLSRAPGPLGRNIGRHLNGLTASGSLSRQLRTLFQHESLATLQAAANGRDPSVGPRRPVLLILGTRLAEDKATLCAFTDRGLYVDMKQIVLTRDGDGHVITSPDCRPEVDGAKIPIREAVAASAAYPGFFPPIVLRRNPSDDGFCISDAGVFDNLGVEAARHVAAVLAGIPGAHKVLLSDATGSTHWKDSESLRGVIASTLRAIDVMLERSRDLSMTSMKAACERASSAPWDIGYLRLAHVPPGARGTVHVLSLDVRMVHTRTPLDNAFQNANKFIRTDFDCFDDVVGASLLAHGYCITSLALDAGDVLGEDDFNEFTSRAGLAFPRHGSAQETKWVQTVEDATFHRSRVTAWDWWTSVNTVFAACTLMLFMMVVPGLASKGNEIRASISDTFLGLTQKWFGEVKAQTPVPDADKNSAPPK